MPCLTQPKLAPAKRNQQKEALARLEAALTSGTVSLIIGASGSIAFRGWNQREDVSDLCAYRALSAANSPALRRAVMRAEAFGGKINQRAIASGHHSHDGGKTWGSH